MEKTTIQVFCNHKMIKLLKPIEMSESVQRDGEHVYAAEYDLATLEAVPDKDYDNGEWRREFGGANTDVDIPESEFGDIFNYICETIGASNERNTAAVLGQQAKNMGITYIDLLNLISKAQE